MNFIRDTYEQLSNMKFRVVSKQNYFLTFEKASPSNYKLWFNCIFSINYVARNYAICRHRVANGRCTFGFYGAKYV